MIKPGWTVYRAGIRFRQRVQPLNHLLAARKLSRARVWFAFSVAAAVDAIQFALGPVGSIVVDQVLDVVAMILISWAIGFHTLLLPTFVLELFPIIDMLPTWTACTAAVVMIRKSAEKSEAAPPIDVQAEVTPVPPKIERAP